MKVAVLEGDFVALCNLGLPFSVSYQLQEKGLKLPDALWTIKSSASGFSVSLVLPSSPGESMKKRKRRRKRAKAKSSVNTKQSDQVNQSNQSASSRESIKHGSESNSHSHSPTKAHHHLDRPRDTAPAQDPVPSQRSGSRSDSHVPIDSSPSTSEPEDEPVDLTACLYVSFELRDGQAVVCFEDSTPLAGPL